MAITGVKKCGKIFVDVEWFGNTLPSGFTSTVNSITIHGKILGKTAQLTLLVRPTYTFLSCRQHSVAHKKRFCGLFVSILWPLISISFLE